MEKKLILFVLLLAVTRSFAQNTYPWPQIGNIGIGTTTPENSEGWTKVLDVFGSTDAKILTSTNAIHTGLWSHEFGFYGAPAGGITGTYSNHPFSIITNKVSRVTINVLGKVGIGTFNPAAKLEVFDPVEANIMIHSSGGDGTNTELDLVGGSPDASWAIGTNKTAAGGAGDNLFFYKNAGLTGPKMVIRNDGNVGIGTTSPDQKLTVNGTIHASQVKVDTSIPVPDYVFKSGYRLKSLQDVKEYIDKNQHLPEIPSASQQEKEGVDLGKMNQLLLKKVEELTIYLIQQDKKIKMLQRKVNKRYKNF
ncbi:hypothetical protein MUY27_03785 [Mucilaginibacter sp. RS28]|uniref:Uncharacterized protein n=1 Tax=Mucilaginibacter straminoryzae TaxID=2932774 RepID=A0A9X2B7P7_9SPHI|nr:hypothetical protein [Mucilaginibacter straminoryzae]MCJ8208814.1 hypothetical protein [Mucilaginibacter straminoryzae]